MNKRSNYKTFEDFKESVKHARVALVRHGRIQITDGAGFKRTFASPELAAFEGAQIRFFIDPTGVEGDEAICFDEHGEWIDNVPEVHPVSRSASAIIEGFSARL